MNTVWTWIKTRWSERSTKIWIINVIGFLSLVGLTPSEAPKKVETVITEGQEIYQEGVDSTHAAIERGTERYEDLKSDVEYAKDTGEHFWTLLKGFWVLLMSAFGIGRKDAFKGQAYAVQVE